MSVGRARRPSGSAACSAGISGATSAMTSYMTSGASPTPRPPSARPSNAQPPDDSSRSSARCARRRSRCMPPCTMPKRSCPGAAAVARQRRAQRGRARHRLLDRLARRVRRRALVERHRDVAAEQPPGSASRARASAAAASRRGASGTSRRPRRSSARSRRLNTWKPPESVRMARGQAMNLCSPPSAAIRSAPGRSARWYVLPRMICAPSRSTIVRRQRLHGRLRADRHEDGRLDRAVRGLQDTCARPPRAARSPEKSPGARHAAPPVMNMASP